MDNSGTQKKQISKKKKWALLILLLLILLGIGIVVMHQFGFFRYPWEKPVTALYSGKPGMLPTLSEEDALKMLQEQADKDQVRIQINSQPMRGEDGTYDVMIQNIETNLYDQVVKIYLGKDMYGDLLYDSGRIKPGYYIDVAEFKINLEPGIYDATGYVTNYDGDEKLSTTSIEMVVIIQ